MDVALGKRIIQLRERIVANFNAGDWEAVGLLTGYSDLIDNHPRLLRSLSWGDEDYAGNALTVLRTIGDRETSALALVEGYLDEHYPGESEYISAKPSVRKITFSPHVFQVPEGSVECDLVAVMMPLRSEIRSCVRFYQSGMC